MYCVSQPIEHPLVMTKEVFAMDHRLQPPGAAEHLESVSFNDCVSSVLSGYGDGISSSSETLSISLRSEEEDDDDDDDERDCKAGQDEKDQRRYEGNGGSLFSSFSKSNKKKVTRKDELSEIEMMKDKFSKLLLGEDMSGGGKGVCSALAISNAITNLSASVFGELWRLEPLSLEKKTMWRREMDWLLSVADHIVELVPAQQISHNGSNIEVMVTRPRPDIHVNLPALKKLDGMLLETLDSFEGTEFWYAEENGCTRQRVGSQGNDEKWWLPLPKVPVEGLSNGCSKQLQHRWECMHQILKAAVAINSQILSEMEIPDAYFDALPKNGKASLGEDIYKHLMSESFYPESVLDMLDLSSEHKAVDAANRIEATIHLWSRRKSSKPSSLRESKESTKSSWVLVKDFMLDMDKKEYLSNRAENLLFCLKQRFPNLRQTLLDITKIQHNKDIGQAVLESYSRVLESLAFNIAARIEDVLYADDMARQSLVPARSSIKTRMISCPRRRYSFNISVDAPYGTPLLTPNASPSPSSSPKRTPNSPLHSDDESRTFPNDYLAYAYKCQSGRDSLRLP